MLLRPVLCIVLSEPTTFCRLPQWSRGFPTPSSSCPSPPSATSFRPAGPALHQSPCCQISCQGQRQYEPCSQSAFSGNLQHLCALAAWLNPFAEALTVLKLAMKHASTLSFHMGQCASFATCKKRRGSMQYYNKLALHLLQHDMPELHPATLQASEWVAIERTNK